MADATPIVFVVDDDISVRESLDLLIRCAGWQAETFASAQEFLTRPRVMAPSCLVLDVDLPDLNGLDLQKRVIERTDMPIIFIYGIWRCPDDGPGDEGGSSRVLDETIQRRRTVGCDPACPRAQPNCTWR
jgi:CheY-like chemotaxis protein